MDTTLTSGQLALQLKLFKEKGMTPERWQRILSSAVFADLCDPATSFDESPYARARWREAFGLGPMIPETFMFGVDYGNLPDVMKMSSDARIAKAPTFRVRGHGFQKFEGRVFDFGNDTKHSGVLARIRAADHAHRWRPAWPEHLEAFSQLYNRSKSAFLVFALGTASRESRAGCRWFPYVLMSTVPHIVTTSETRDDVPYGGQCRFLAVRPWRPIESLITDA